MLAQAPKDRPRNFRPGRLGFCASRDFEHTGIYLFDDRRTPLPSRGADCAHQPRQFLLHRVGNSVTVAASKPVQNKFLDVDLEGAASDRWQVMSLTRTFELCCNFHEAVYDIGGRINSLKTANLKNRSALARILQIENRQ
jgi:hypothetical protein